jgi:hypothetical protein
MHFYVNLKFLTWLMSLIQACFSCMVEATRWTVIWLLLEPWLALPPDEVLLTSSTSLKSLLCRSDDLCEPPLDEIRWVVVVVLPSLAPLDWLDAEHTEAPDRLISTHRQTSHRRRHAYRGIRGRHAKTGAAPTSSHSARKQVRENRVSFSSTPRFFNSGAKNLVANQGQEF